MKAWFGPVGELRQVECFPGVQVTSERPVDVFTGLSGRRTHFVGRRVYRSWSLSYVWSDPELVDWLAQLASGGVVGPHYLYTSKAEAENLAPTLLQSGGSGVVAGRRVLATGDPEVRQWIVPVRPNTSYTLSALGDGVGTVEVIAAGVAHTGFGYGSFGQTVFGE